MAKTQVRSQQIEDGGVTRDDLNTTTTTKAVVTKIIQGANCSISSTGVDSGTGDVTVNGPSLTVVEQNLCAAPNTKRGGHFTIAGTSLVAGKPVFIQQAAGPFTGKGTRTDETEMDIVRAVGVVRNATTIDVYWDALHQVRGNFKFQYMVGA